MGQAKAPWTWAGETFCDCADAEGNVLQLIARGAASAGERPSG